MEQGSSMPSRGLSGHMIAAGGLLPHAYVDKMSGSTNPNYNLRMYKNCMNCALILLLCTLIEFACPFKGLTWFGFGYLFLLLFPYLGIIGQPLFFFYYTVLAILFTFINFCVNASSDCPNTVEITPVDADGASLTLLPPPAPSAVLPPPCRYSCWGVAVFIEIPMIIVESFLLYYLKKTDPAVAAKLAACFGGGGGAAPTMHQHGMEGMGAPGTMPSIMAPGSKA